ncbi:MAG: beta-ketoacyl-[acyl-carrier-protein] synthase family protein [bacterium]
MISASNEERIVITGFGLSCPLGEEPDAVVGAMLRCQDGLVRRRFGERLDLWVGETGVADACDEDGFPIERTILLARRAAERALAMAGFGANPCNPWRRAVVAGSSKGGLLSLIRAIEEKKRRGDSSGKSFSRAFTQIPGNRVALDLALRHGMCGPALDYPAACATGAHCLLRAAQLLRENEADVVLAGSTEACLHPLYLASFENMGVLAKNKSRPFVADRDGFNAGEGAAFVVLERECDAKARGAEILAALLGGAIPADPYHPTALDPSGEGIQRAIHLALRDARMTPANLDAVKVHGTGTAQNDAIESRALHSALGEHARLLPVFALKQYVGHLLGASGSVEAILALLAARESFLPPLLDARNMDPDCNLCLVAGAPLPGAFENLLLLSYGFGGHLGALVLQVS